VHLRLFLPARFSRLTGKACPGFYATGPRRRDYAPLIGAVQAYLSKHKPNENTDDIGLECRGTFPRSIGGHFMKPLDASKFKPLEGGPSFALGNRLYRLAWMATWGLAASWTPPFMYSWRRLILRIFGAQVASSARVYSSVKIWLPSNLIMEEHSCLGPKVICYNMDCIHLRSYVIISQGAHLCAGTHDIRDPTFQLLTHPITIEDRAWVATEAFIGPGVRVGQGAVVGARAVVFKDVPPWMVVIGNPARVLKSRSMQDGKLRS
jgi:putative colanic acid biosynthesis acetyltransferase WcaF